MEKNLEEKGAGDEEVKVLEICRQIGIIFSLLHTNSQLNKDFQTTLQLGFSIAHGDRVNRVITASFS